ncbi:putative transmembrane Acr-type transport protein [Halobacteriovorax marinus SJ]|uniref:Transmembrane Acr-type transport protein n=1 Tax=Halobacteriovorax marinus (strain ATCC BAA-682 / DSM 15412 / SJ) TaxID=862908 RepID=E1X578_HALMS|nr:efflux RND transporter permease subunit [Halobacteriovorax marinus]CBW25550.1 putative transmembrane Acr-type transport protein [Halobacteriovorax marinus SJ]
MKTLSKFFIDNSKLSIVLMLGLLIYGIMGLAKMNAESYPNVSFATAIVTTRYDGATAQDIETKITKPIEDEIRTVRGLKDVNSTSQSGLSTIVIRVDMDRAGIDVETVISDIQKAVDRTNKLPADLIDRPKFSEIKSEEMPVFQIAVLGSNENRSRDIIADHLKEELEDNKLIKGVTLEGFAKRTFQIEVNNDLLNKHHIGMQELISKIQARNVNIPGGNLKQDKTQQLLRLEGKIKNTKELENILIRSNFSGQSIYLKDVAKVVDGEEEIKVRTRYNGEEATLLTIAKKAGADTITLVDDVEKKLHEYEKLYTDKADFKVFLNESIKVKDKLDVLANNAVSGLILVIVFLFIFLPGKIGLMASLSLPLAIMGTLGIMPAFGMNLNTITVLALVIALGMLVDNSVVISENFTRLRQEGKNSKEAALESIKSLWLPITATAFTTIAAFLPMLVTKGIMGQFIKWIPIIVTISLLLSLVESFFFLPMRLVSAGNSVKKDKDGNSKKDWFHKFENKFEKIMTVIVRRRYIAVAGFSALIVFALFMMTAGNKFILFPADQTEIYIARFELPNGTKLEETNSKLRDLSNDIKEVLGKDVKHLIGKSGESKVQLTDPKATEGNNVGIVFIYVTDEAKLNLFYTTVLEKLRAQVPKDGYKSLTFEAQVNGPPVGSDIEATFRSNDMEQLDSLIGKIKARLEKVPGVLDLKVNDIIGDDEVFINIDYEKADQLGLNIFNAGDTVRSAISGRIISEVTLNNKDVDLRVSFKESDRTDITKLKDVNIMDSRGNLVPLGTFAKFETKDGTPQIKRFDFKRSKTLAGSINEKKITAMEANQILLKTYEELRKDFPSVSLVFGGVAESTKESMESLAQASVLAAIGIFAILVFLFKSYLRPLIIMMTIPLGLLGFSIAFATPVLSGYMDRTRPISFLALIGIIGLAGIIVNSGIVLISFIDEMRAEGKLSLEEILIKASGMRLRAVLVTSLTTVSGLFPTAYGVGGSDPTLVPMTLAMAWGLTSGTILTLSFIPPAYAILEDFLNLVNRITKRKKHIEEDMDGSEELA